VKDIVEQGIALREGGCCHRAPARLRRGERAADRRSGRVTRAIIEVSAPRWTDRLSDHPTTGLKGQAGEQTPQQRFAHVEELARRRLIEWAAVDPGSTNFAHYDELRETRPVSSILIPRTTSAMG